MTAKAASRPPRAAQTTPRRDATTVIRAFVRTLERIEGAKRPRGGGR